MDSPTGVTVMADGNIAVANDTRVLILTPNGDFVRSVASNGEVTLPRGLMALPNNGLVIADGAQHRLVIFAPGSGRIVKRIGTGPGKGQLEFSCPSGIAVLENGDLAVCDQRNHRVKVVTQQGEFVRHIGRGTRGSGRDEFNCPWGITRTQRNNLAICDQDNNRIVLCTVTGEFLAHYGDPSCRGGPGIDQFARPRGICVLPSGDLAVTDIGNHRVKVLTERGVFVRSIERLRSPLFPGELTLRPLGIAVLRDGTLAIGDWDCHRITIVRP